MPRRERITEPGFYHVISRGVERRNLFLDGDEDRGQTLILHFFYHVIVCTVASAFAFGFI